MRDLRSVDRISLCMTLCCGLGLGACSDEVGGADDLIDPGSSSVTDDPSTLDATVGAGSSSTDPASDTDTDPSEGSSSDESSGGAPECTEDAQCDDAEPCTLDHCTDGVCVATALDGIAAPDAEQTEGDCALVTCVAGTPTPTDDDADLPVDDDDCTDDVCAAGVPSNPASGAAMCTPEPVCNDGLDDDEDGAIDCLDDDCDGISGCELGTELTCNDGVDNDGDIDIDCQDSDCDGISGCELGVELTCNDGLDNDGDGALDCLDVGCNGTASCEYGTEYTCDDGIDNDGNGALDCVDIDCSGSASCVVQGEVQCNDGIDNDGNGLTDSSETNCGWVNAAMPCAAGHAFGFSALDLPIAISSVGTATVDSFIPVGVGGTVGAVVVRIDVAHTYDSDLDITLLSALSTPRQLSADNGGAGGSGDNFTGTVFSDGGAGVIGTAGFDNPPYAGTYRPEEAFVPTLTGEPINGSWNLHVFDQFNLDGGSLNTFQLGICTQ